MQLDEQDRQSLRERLEEVLGSQPTGVLMDLLETHPDNELARRSDVLAIGAKLNGIDVRLEGIDVRLEGIDVRLEGIDVRLDRIEGRMDGIEGRMDGIDARMDAFDRRIEGVETRLTLQSAVLTKTVVFTGIATATSSWGLLFGAMAFA